MGQRGGDYGERMAAAFADAHATAALPMLLIRADALEITPDMLEDAARSLVSGEADAAFGPASDGGFWLLGLRQPDRSLVVGIPAPVERRRRRRPPAARTARLGRAARGARPAPGDRRRRGRCRLLSRELRPPGR